MADQAITFSPRQAAELTTRARRQTIGDLLAASALRYPDKIAVSFDYRRHTYAELDAAVDTVAAALVQRGLGKGDRLALLAHNSDTFAIVYFASARVGSILVPVNFMLSAEEVGYILGHSGATALVVEHALLPLATQALATSGRDSEVTLRAVIDQGEHEVADGWEAVTDWLAGPAATPPEAELSDGDPLELLYTSGTESRPKGAILTSRSVIAQHTSCFVDGEMRPDDVEVHALPLFHSAQLHCFFTPDIHLGATSVILPGADPAQILAAVERERATKLFCPPTMWIALLHHPDFYRRDLSSLRKGYYGASIMPVEVLHELARTIPAVRLFNFYGQTEMSPLATVLGPEDQERKAGSAGRPAVNVQTMIVDDEGVPLPAGEVGEIVHRSPQAMLGYWDDAAKSAETFSGGWLHTGDLGIIDDEGYLYVVDRKKDMIKTGGENVASREVEEVLHAHPAIKEAAVFGVPHPRWIEAVTATVVLREDTSLEVTEIRTFCRQRLAGFKTPKYVVFRDHLPKNASGKILKRDLREQYLDLAETDQS